MDIRYCPRCGEARWPDARFCRACGFAYESVEPGSRTTPAPADHGTHVGGPRLDSAPWSAAQPVAIDPEANEPGAREFTGYPEVAGLSEVPDALNGWADAGWPEPAQSSVATSTGWPARHLAGLAFAMLGAALITAGSTAIILGLPRAATGLVPLDSILDLQARLTELAPLLGSVAAGLVALVVAVLFAARLLRPAWATGLFIVLGVTADAAIVVSLDRVAYDAAGSVLPGPIVAIAGGGAILAAALVCALIRD